MFDVSKAHGFVDGWKDGLDVLIKGKVFWRPSVKIFAKMSGVQHEISGKSLDVEVVENPAYENSVVEE